MRKVIASVFVTLDGVYQAPGDPNEFERGGWVFQYSKPSDDSLKYSAEQLFASDALLLGKSTYEGFAKAWPSMTGDPIGYGKRMNDLPKYVVSSTLKKAEWNNSTILTGNLTEEVTKLKQQPGQNILVFGSGRLVNSLLQSHLIDELRLLIIPVVLGNGARLFNEEMPKGMKLVDARPFSSGTVALAYEPVEGEAQAGRAG
jgi:dihydrofolate reductase